MAVWAAVIITISTVTVSSSAETEGYTSHFMGGEGAIGDDHEDYTNPNIYDGKRCWTRDIHILGVLMEWSSFSLVTEWE